MKAAYGNLKGSSRIHANPVIWCCVWKAVKSVVKLSFDGGIYIEQSVVKTVHIISVNKSPVVCAGL